MSPYSPFVTIVTPVYNGGNFLAECIDSVRNQDYKNWEYVIVNNCSTDSTLDVALHYADLDTRIRIVNNSSFVNVVENHNIAFSMTSSESKYCKMVSADDWIYPDCVTKLVDLAERHPTVGIVGSYQESKGKVRWKGLSPNMEVISGNEVCRLTLLENLDVFGNPTSSLYRSDLIRKNKPFFSPNAVTYADTYACFKYLQYSDFGFVHEILSGQRIHKQQVTTRKERLNIGDFARLHYMLKYGPIYLTEEEFEEQENKYFEEYYRTLGGCVLKLKGRELWQWHTSEMRKLGYAMQWKKVVKGGMTEIIEEIQNPSRAFNKLVSVVKEKCRELYEAKP